MKSIDIFIKSYHKDFRWLYHALTSITRNVTGYNKVILLIPETDKASFDTRNLPDRTEVHYVRDEGNGWLRQQYFKLTAYKYSFAEFILFSDSDCFFDHPIDLQEFVKDGKPEILYTDWAKVDQAICWKEPTEKIMGEAVPWEFMRRNQLIYYRETLVNLHKWRPSLEQLIMKSPNGRFSEFNLLGAYAFKFEPHNYTWINTDNWTYVEPKAIQIWSHGSKEAGVSETHLREYIRILESLMKAYGIHV